MSWFSRWTESHNAQLTVTAVASAAFAIATVYTIQGLRKDEELKRVKSEASEEAEIASSVTRLNEFGGAAIDLSAPSEDDQRSAALALRAREGDFDDELILEQLARNRVFLTDKGLAELRESFIVVVGCGGVGSHAAAALCRSGVSKIRLIDFDQVTLSSLNRHAVATLADVGTPKVHTIRKRLEQVTPWVHFDCRNELFNGEVAAKQLEAFQGRQPDYVVDAIDNIDSKVELLHYCKTNGIKVISSMGAGCKSDPTRILIGDISASTDDPLSRSTRVRLRKLGVKDGIPVVYSSEKAGPGKAELLPLPEDEYQRGNVGELSVLKDFRVRILPVLGTMPAIFGLTVANHVMLSITDYPHEYLPSKSRDKVYDAVFASLQGMEEKLARATGIDAVGLRVPIAVDDVGYLLEEIFRGRSVVSGLASRLSLIRWRKPTGALVDESIPGQKKANLLLEDLVLMTKDEATRHLKEVLLGNATVEELYGKEVLALVEKRRLEQAAFAKYR